MSASRYRLIVDGEGWEWNLKYDPVENLAEMLDYAKWLVEMPWHAPEAKADHSLVIDTETGQTLYEGKRTDHRPYQGDWTWIDPKCENENNANVGHFREPIGPEKRLGRAMLTAYFLLVAIALGLSIACLIWPKPALGPVALVLVCIALLLLTQLPKS